MRSEDHIPHGTQQQIDLLKRILDNQYKYLNSILSALNTISGKLHEGAETKTRRDGISRLVDEMARYIPRKSGVSLVGEPADEKARYTAPVTHDAEGKPTAIAALNQDLRNSIRGLRRKIDLVNRRLNNIRDRVDRLTRAQQGRSTEQSEIEADVTQGRIDFAAGKRYTFHLVEEALTKLEEPRQHPVVPLSVLETVRSTLTELRMKECGADDD